MHFSLVGSQLNLLWARCVTSAVLFIRSSLARSPVSTCLSLTGALCPLVSFIACFDATLMR